MRIVPIEANHLPALTSQLSSSPNPQPPKGYHPLGALAFSSKPGQASPSLDRPHCTTLMPPAHSAACYEIWYSAKPVQSMMNGPVQVAFDGDILFGTCTFPANDLAAGTRRAYGDILEILNTCGYTNLLRMWNHIPHINLCDQNGQERYRAFCKGRSLALLEDRNLAEAALPAGTGVGCLGDSVTIAFLSARDAIAVHLENPDQMPAYHYPQCYGPRSPSFARATAVNYADSSEIFVSGTASITGHQTRCLEDIVGQCNTTFANLDKLLSRNNLTRYGIDADLSTAAMDHLRVYVRYPQHFQAVKTACESAFGRDVETVYLTADICRAELLVEIEGRVSLPPVKGGGRAAD